MTDDLLEEEFPVAHHGCTCMCHRVAGVKHFAPCCYPDDDYWDIHEPFKAAQVSQDSQTDMDA